MSAARMDECLKLLRYVKKGDYLLTQDINVPRECIFVARAWLEAIVKAYNLDPTYVYELDPYLKRLRYVRVGDILEPDDHNAIVDALKKLREVLEKIEALVCDKCCKDCYSDGWNDGILWCQENLLPIHTDLILGADVALDSRPDAEIDSAAILGADVAVDIDPSEEIGATSVIGADTVIDEVIDVASDVSIEPQA